MQIALVAVVLLAGIWFAVLRPKAATTASSPAPVAAQPATSTKVAPGVKGLAGAVQKAQGAAATSAAANAKAGADATSTASATAAKPSATKAATTAKAKPATTATKAKAKAPAAAKTAPAKAAATTDPSQTLLSFLAKGKVVVLLFHANGADDRAARKAVHRVAAHDKHVVSAYADISKVGNYAAITSGIDVTTAPTILVIGKDRTADVLTGIVDAGVIQQAVGDARRAAAQGK